MMKERVLEQKGRKKTNKNIDTYDRLSFESFINYVLQFKQKLQHCLKWF